MSAPTIPAVDLDEVQRPRRNQAARSTERRQAIDVASGRRRHRSREREAL